jgi:ATP-dependent helicase HrpA
MPRGLRRLLLGELPSPARSAVRSLDTGARLALSHHPYASVPALLDDCAAAAVDALVGEAGGAVWDESAYLALRERVRAALPAAAQAVVHDAADVLAAAHEVALGIERLAAGSVVRDDLEAQLAGLVYPGFVSDVGAARLPHLRRYLSAMQRRLSTLQPSDPRDARRMAEAHAIEDAYHEVVDRLSAARRRDDDVRAVRWLLEEYRVSLFAQQLGTAAPVSPTRIRAALAAVAASG